MNPELEAILAKNPDQPITAGQLTWILEQLGPQKHLIPPTPPPPAPASPTKEPKIKDPKPFSGERGTVNLFISKCRLQFMARPTYYATESSKVAYAAALLEGEPYLWFEPVLEMDPPPIERTSFDAFARVLKSMYGDPDEEHTAEVALSKLKQKTSTAAYAAEFRRFQTRVTWNDAALRHAFHAGLKEEVKDRLAQDDRVESLEELMAKAVRIDNRLFERQKERGLSKRALTPTAKPWENSRTTLAQTYGNPNITPVPTKDPNAMEIDAVGSPRKITPEEKKRRWDLKLCHYCASPDHAVLNCPLRPQKLIATQSSEPGKEEA